MKIHHHHAVIAAVLAAAGLLATSTFAAEQKGKEARIEKKITVESTGDPHTLTVNMQSELVTFLGVEAVSAPPALSAQLKLPEGYGLVVNVVVPDSPAAAAGLQKHDVLLRLDDQILVDQRQLSVLVRAKKEGDKVTLTYIRGGAEARATATLAKKDLPHNRFEFRADGPMEWNSGDNTFRFFNQAMPAPVPGGAGHVIELRDRAIERIPRIAPSTGARRVMIYRPKTNIVLDDDDGMLELRVDDDVKTLVAKNAKGEVIFSGPISTDEQRKAVPADLLKRLEKLEQMEVAEPPEPPEPPVPAVAPAAPVPAVAPSRAPLTDANEPESMPRSGGSECFRRALRLALS
jgi:serine protease Do